MRQLICSCILFCVIILMAHFSSCSYDQYAPEEEPVVTDSVSFADDILPIFNAACNSAGCHNTGGVPPDLSPGRAYDALISGGFINVANPTDSELYQWMIGNRDLDMPLEGPDPEYNALVLAWITQGAVNN